MLFLKPHQQKIYSKFDFPDELALERAILENKSEKSSSLGSAVGTILGLSASIALARKNQPIKDVFVKNDFQKTAKNFWKYTKLDYDGFEGMKYMLLQAGGACFGSFVAASIKDKDKENRIEKFKEALFVMSNVAVPTLFAKTTESILNRENNKGILQTISKNKILKNAAVVLSLAAGLATSLSVVNTINTKIVEPDDKRKKKIKPTDMIAHIDDIIPILISSKGSPLQKLPLDRTLPVIYFILGKKVGEKNAYTFE